MMFNSIKKLGNKFSAQLIATIGIALGMQRTTWYDVECRDAEGRLKWKERKHNLVVDAGLNDSLTQHFKGSAYTAAWYVGITTASNTFAAGDTMVSHVGWVESAVYSNGTRPALTLGAVAAKSVDNSASKAVFNINASGTVGGAFIVTNNTISGSTGTIYGGAAFAANRTVASGDTITVTVTLTAA
jgi:hypothetical protein